MNAKKAKAKRPAAKRPAAKRPKIKLSTPELVRQFRFTAAAIVKIQFLGEKKPELFRVDDMVEATIAALDGQTRLYFQYRLVSNDKRGRDGADRVFWFLDPKPVAATDPFDPSLWQAASDQTVDGFDVVKSCSGNFSTKSVTSYDGSGVRHVVRLNDTPTYRMRLDLNGKREFCESLPLEIRKGDVLAVASK